MTDDTPYETPPTGRVAGAARTDARRPQGEGIVKRRPVRGVRVEQVTFDSTFGQPFGEEVVYECPLKPKGFGSSELAGLPEDHQAAVALHWFSINFRPLGEAEQLVFSNGERAFFSDGSPILFGSPSTSVALIVDSTHVELVNDNGAALANDEGRKLVADRHVERTVFHELRAEFGGLTADDLLQQLADGLRAHSPRWQFIPLPDPLAIELDDVGRLQSEVDAARVRRDIDELEAHLAAQAAAPQAHGQNYWPGAELLDDGLRNETKEVTETLREAASAAVTPTEPVKQSISRLVGIRNKVGQWIAEGAVRGLAADAAKWGISSTPLWWHWLYHLLSQLLTDTQAWLLSLLGG